MNWQNALRIVRSYSMTLTRKDGQYRVNFRDGTESTAYYADDLDDAVGTAQAMYVHRQKNKN